MSGWRAMVLAKKKFASNAFSVKKTRVASFFATTDIDRRREGDISKATKVYWKVASIIKLLPDEGIATMGKKVPIATVVRLSVCNASESRGK